MSEVLRELVVALSLDSDSFARNLRTINQQIKEAESTFCLAGAGVGSFEKIVKGTKSKLAIYFCQWDDDGILSAVCRCIVLFGLKQRYNRFIRMNE